MQKKTTKKKRPTHSKSKQRSKKLATFNESDFSLLEQNPQLSSISDLFKNQALKKKHHPTHSGSQINFNSTVNNYTSVYTVVSSLGPLKIQKQKQKQKYIKNIIKGVGPLPSKKKVPQKSKSKSKILPTQNINKKDKPTKKKAIKQQKLQSYELIPQSKNSLNSQIVFSTQDTKRYQSESQNIKDSSSSRIYDSINFSKLSNNENILMNTNKMLRSTIRQQFKRKNQAATKIQKVFRGYLTRKILQKYIKEQQEKLNELLAGYKSSNRKSKQISHRSQKSNDYQFFSSKNSISQRDHTSKTFQDEQSINLSKINPIIFKQENQQNTSSKKSSEGFHSHRFFNNKENQIVNCENEIMSSDQNQDEVLNQQQQCDSFQKQSEQQSSELSSQEQIVAYRHQQPIYSGAQIQKFLQFSSQDEEENQGQNKKFKNILNHDQIIFQTNEEHIQSRKNSLLNKNVELKNKKSLGVNHCLVISNQKQKMTYPQSIFKQDQNISKKNKGQNSEDFDLVKTSKVCSIRQIDNENQASMPPIKIQQQSISINRDCNQYSKIKLALQSEENQKTSKKECKRVIDSQKRSLNIQINSSQQQQSGKKVISKTLNQNCNQESHMQTIKIPKDQINIYKISENDDKKVFMDTISYNSQFKAKHQINSHSNNRLNEKKNNPKNNQQQKKKKSSSKKQIYYFSDSSEYEDTNSLKNDNGSFLFSSKGQTSSNIKQFQKLKTTEIKKWDQVIKLINQQMSDSAQKSQRNKQFENFINQVMDLSLKNKTNLKDLLANQSQQVNQDEASANKNSRLSQLIQQSSFQKEPEKKLKDFKNTLSNGRRKSITQQEISIFKPNSRIIILSKDKDKISDQDQLKSPTSKPSFFKQQKDKIKQKINKIEEANLKHFQANFNGHDSRIKQYNFLNNLQNDHIEEMLKIREQMLQKRQCQQLTKLNQKLIKKQIAQKQFLDQLKILTSNFQAEKTSIDQARQDIAKGYNAALRLIKEAFCDAKKIGYKLPLSKSSDSYKLNKNLGYGLLNGINNVIIDELNSKDPTFSLKHVKFPPNQRKNESQKTENIKFQNQFPQKSESNENQCQEIRPLKLKQLKNQSMQQERNQFLPTNKSLSFESSSIINNLSSNNSFKDQYFEAQIQQHDRDYSPKHQSIKQSSGSLNISENVSQLQKIFFQNPLSGQFDNLSEESSQIQFSQQQLRRFRKAKPYDPSIVDMNRNLMLGKDFIQMQKSQENYNSSSCGQEQNQKTYQDQQPENLRLRLYRQVYEIQQNDQEDSKIPIFMSQKQRHDPKIDLITQKQLEFLIFQISCQILMKPLFSQKFLFQKRQQMFGIKKVGDDTRKQYLKIVQRMLPSQDSLVSKLNQNISPLPKQLLKCMRIDFSQEDDIQNEQNEQQYEQIGKYEMILDQQLCNEAIQKYQKVLQIQKQQTQQIQHLTCQTVQSIQQQFSFISCLPAWEQKVFNYLSQRQKFVKNRKQHCEGIRWQFINMELHCIFDAWNEQIIELKANRSGFSGIGLNEISLSMIDRNKIIKPNNIEQLMQESKFRVMKILRYQDDIIQQINNKICDKINFLPPQDSRLSQRTQKSLQTQIQQNWQKYSWVYEPSKQIQQQLMTDEQSKWVYYADEALSYGLQLVYLVEEQLFGELAKQIRKISLKRKF